jgi:hypothetical protein
MTAINVLITPEYASIITDTKATTPLGVSFNVAKVFAIPHMRLAIATRGKITALETVSRAVSQHCFNYESARAFLADHFDQLDLGNVDVFVAGWSEGGPAAFLISNVNSASKVTDIGYLALTPTVSPELFDRLGSDPIGEMQTVMQAQADGNSAVGGFINVTQVGAALIETYTAGVIDALAIRPPHKASLAEHAR